MGDRKGDPFRICLKDSVNYGGIPYFFIKFLATAKNMVYSDSRLLVFRRFFDSAGRERKMPPEAAKKEAGTNLRFVPKNA